MPHGKIRVVDATRHDDDETPETAAGTLGRVLYGDTTAKLVSERAWVALVEAVAAGDQAALHELYERTHRIVYTLVFRITNNRESADELTLDVFHDVWRRAASFDASGGTVVGWIMNQARSRAIDRLRFEQRRKRTPPPGEGFEPEEIGSDPRQMLETTEQSRLVRSAMAVLTEDERKAIEAAFFSGLTYAETAERLSQPLGTIKTRIRSGLGKLRQSLDRTEARK